MKHTPAPWEYIEGVSAVFGRSVGGRKLEDQGFVVADIRGWGHLQYLPNGKEIQNANGQLIAAAPELLSALEEMLVHFTKVPSTLKDSEVRGRAHAAINKATGYIPNDKWMNELSAIAKAKGEV